MKEINIHVATIFELHIYCHCVESRKIGSPKIQLSKVLTSLHADNTHIVYTDRHPVRVRENRRILSTEMEFLKNFYAFVLKVPSHN